jgi:succinate-acetate transporter protein
MDETFHIQSAYLELDPTGRMLNNAIGLYLTGWLILTTMLLICTVRSTVPLFSTFLCLDLLFMLLTAGYMSGSASVMRGAGGVALATAILGFYNSFAGVATKENSWVELKPLFMPGAQRPDAPDLEKSANDYSSKN